MQVIIDTGFIVHCIRKNIDFVKNLEDNGFLIMVPKGVLQEINHLNHDIKTNQEEKNSINRFLESIDKNKKIKRISEGNGNISDWLLMKDKEGCYIATIDKGIKHQLKNRITLLENTNEIVFDKNN